MKEVIIILTRQVLILFLEHVEKGGFRNEKKVAKEKEEAIQKANIGGM